MAMRKIFCLILFSLCFLSIANALPSSKKSYPISIFLHSIEEHIFTNIQLGQLITESGDQQTLSFSAVNYNLYQPNQKARGAMDYSLGIGVYQNLNGYLRLSLGIALAQTLNQSVSGTVYQYELFPNLKYQYDVRNIRLMVTTRWAYELSANWSVFADLDLGIADVTAHNYAESALIEESVPNPPFAATQKTGFTYQLGLGTSYKFHDLPRWRWNAGVGYLRLPKYAELGAAPLQTTNDRLTLGNLSGARLWAGVTYYFDQG